MVTVGAKNRYVVMPPRRRDEIPWNPCDPSDIPVPDCAYIGRALAAMERLVPTTGLTFYLTSDLQWLPSYGPNVVVLLISDEWCRVPRYAHDVRVIFKTYGTALAVNWRALTHPTLYDLAALAQDVRTSIRRLPGLLRARRHADRSSAPIFPIPLGYFRQILVPPIDIAQRRFDVYFAGSVTNNGVVSRRSRLSPKYLSRAIMLEQLRGVHAAHPELAITTSLTASFLDTTEDDATRYSRAMMETKICLVPRGTSLETYRYFEGLRSGCVVVTERLPQRWFYDEAPTIRVRSWSELDRLIPRLLADPDRLAELSRASFAWWSAHCSEDAVGAYIAARIVRPELSH